MFIKLIGNSAEEGDKVKIGSCNFNSNEFAKVFKPSAPATVLTCMSMEMYLYMLCTTFLSLLHNVS